MTLKDRDCFTPPLYGGVRNDVKRVLIINPFGIGDVLFTTPVIRAIKEAYPDSYIGYWSNLRVKPLLESNPKINKLFALSRGDLKKIYRASFISGLLNSLKLLRDIKKGHFDICFDFSLDHRYGLFAKLTGIRRRIGFNYKGRGRFLTDKIDISGYNDKHAVEYYLDLLRFLGIGAKDKSLELIVSFSEEEKARNFLAARGIEKNDLVIGIVPGAGGSWGKDASYKHWPALKFAQTADRLIDEFKAKIVILGDRTEQAISDVIINAMRNKPIDLTGKIKLERLPAVIKNLNLLISNDGGPMHMAVALGVKTVSVFGPVSELVYGPYPDHRNHIVLKWDMQCRPCYRNFKLEPCDKERECLKSVNVEDVFAAASMLLN
ncbi:MAG: glycosyltransferase family 9 protein [Candidatus Omnitrophota bacterium]|nr:glycosyltransferase family 9 protein [Candidatus Omnitrophota bacterium]